MALTFKETTGTDQPGSAGFALEGSRAIGYYLLDAGTGPDDKVTAQDVLDARAEILGKQDYAAGSGIIRRTLPKAHPQYVELFASNISRIWGVGRSELEDAATGLEGKPLAATFPGSEVESQFALYKQYNYQVEFAPRPYAVASDEQIPILDGSWYDESGVQHDFAYAAEWYRFTDFTESDASSNDVNVTQVGGQLGQMKFVSSEAEGPDGRSFPGVQQMTLPNSLLTIRWFFVPYRYVTSRNSYLKRFKNKVNQNAWEGGGVYAEPGELLYLGYSAVKFTPPGAETDLEWPGVISTNKFCHIDLNFLLTTRAVQPISEAQTPTNRNYVVGGHNALPWFHTRRYYYATTSANIPSYFSFPVEILFTDPDFEGGIPRE